MVQGTFTRLGVSQTETYYVPAFAITVRGQELPATVRRDVIDVTYQDSTEQIDSFTLTVNNWDADRRQPKYIGADVASNSPASTFARFLAPGNEIELRMGYQNDPAGMQVMIIGYITTIEPDFPESGAPKITVRALDVLDTLRKNQRSWAWDNARDSDIAREMGQRPDHPNGPPGLGVPVEIDPRARGREDQEYVVMHNQYPIVFLLERARRRGYELTVKYVNGKRSLYFGPSRGTRQVSYCLEWGRSLVSFRPTLTSTNQITQVTVCGWDRRTKQPIEETVRLQDLGPLNQDLQRVALAANRQEVITDWPVHTRQEARERARSFLRRQLQNIVRADGVTVGLPLLRTGSRLQIDKLGPDFSGNYFVTGTTHTINDSGYRTTFKARREQGG